MESLQPRVQALVEPQQVATPVAGGAVSLPCAGEGDAGRATIVAEDPERLEIVLDAAAPAFLVQTDTWYPGWVAELDGEAVPLLRTDLVFRGVSVPSGGHELVLRYAPAWKRWLWPALGAWLVLLGAVLGRLVRRRPAKA